MAGPLGQAASRDAVVPNTAIGHTPKVRRYLTPMKTTVSSKGQIVLPAELRQLDDIQAGQEFDVERVDRGEYRLVQATRLLQT